MTSLDTAPTDLPTTRTPLALEDVPALTALLNRVDAAEQHGEPAEEPSIREWLTMPGLDLERDTLAVREGEQLIGFAVVDVHTSLDRDGRVRCQLMGAVDPARRRRGLGGALFDWAEDRAAQLAAERHPAGIPAIFRAGGGRDPEQEIAGEIPLVGGADVRPLLTQRGYERARSWLVMRRELPGAALPSNECEQVQVIAPEDDHVEATRLAHLAAFADHWGSAPVSPERWSRWWSAHTARRELSSIALDADGTVLAYVITSEDKPGMLHIALVGTRPEARGRGLARAVIARTLAAAAEAGYSHAELEVDAESLTGATRLYDALGFVRDAVHGTYEKPVGRRD
ncbi:GNAT family N-acetyltransferase [Brachybacterium massiliense]|uniref:GNAT family N-acetyltransferase n=1 Tax=Brachybacterium massiliense TaxID=1755098 RepID=UPI000B3BB6A2|nr:GNAT family N-acetyltransferase [Brachybacterium massiliense]